MNRKTFVILGSLIIGTLIALLETYKEFKYITASLSTIITVAGFIITIWSLRRDDL